LLQTINGLRRSSLPYGGFAVDFRGEGFYAFTQDNF